MQFWRQQSICFWIQNIEAIDDEHLEDCRNDLIEFDNLLKNNYLIIFFADILRRHAAHAYQKKK